jgi:hypothetical protein
VEYPLFNVISLALFVVGLLILVLRPRNPADRETKAA